MAFYHDTPANIAYLAGQLPRMPTNCAQGWLRCEGQGVNNPSNPLNIRYTGAPGQLRANSAGFAVYASPLAGLRAAAAYILNLPYYVHVKAALPSGDGLKIARAIEDSPWAAGHYGGAGAKDGCIADYVKAHPDGISGGGNQPATKGDEVKFVNTSGYTVQTGLVINVGKGSRWTYMDGSSGGRMSTDAALPIVGIADGNTNRHVVLVNTGTPYPDKMPRPTLVIVTSTNKPYAED